MDELINELREIKKLLTLQKQMLTVDEFCLYTGLSRQQTYKLTSQRKIKFFKPLGKIIYFEIDDVIDFLKSNQIQSTSAKSKKIDKYFIIN